VIYNLVAVPLAAAGFVAPALAAGLMIASSLSVTLNSARLAFWPTDAKRTEPPHDLIGRLGRAAGSGSSHSPDRPTLVTRKIIGA
jgi:hypothetical protein